jgi:hypothetical protein
MLVISDFIWKASCFSHPLSVILLWQSKPTQSDILFESKFHAPLFANMIYEGSWRSYSYFCGKLLEEPETELTNANSQPTTVLFTALYCLNTNEKSCGELQSRAY